jgi:hypothetical protein
MGAPVSLGLVVVAAQLLLTAAFWFWAAVTARRIRVVLAHMVGAITEAGQRADNAERALDEIHMRRSVATSKGNRTRAENRRRTSRMKARQIEFGIEQPSPLLPHNLPNLPSDGPERQQS